MLRTQSIEGAFLRWSARNPEFAGRWLEGLLRAIAALDRFPTRHPHARESDAFGRPGLAGLVSCAPPGVGTILP
jgi:hypothetical protein